MDSKRPKPLRFDWPLSPRRPRFPSSCSSSAFSSRVPSFSSDITEFHDAAEDWSENIEQATYYRKESVRYPNLKTFTFEELKQFTMDFHPDLVLGKRGLVYKGWIAERTFAPPGSGIAVAVRIQNSSAGHQDNPQWQADIFYRYQLRHPNIVELIGFCWEDDHLAFVHEYIERGSLDNHLFKRSWEPPSWTLRIKIAIGVAKALAFLHYAESPIIFGNVKTSTVLLDKEFNAKLMGFSLAIAGPVADGTRISTQFMGKCGYAAPEYIATGKPSVKIDVYGFGVVLLELLSGHPAFDKRKSFPKRDIVDWAKLSFGKKRKLALFMDSRLEGQYPKEGANVVAKIALKCIDKDAKLRPNMADVLRALERIRAVKGDYGYGKDDALWEPSESPEAAFHGSNTLASLYRRPSFLTYHGSLEKAKTEASLQNKWLIVNMQTEEEFNSHMLNRDTWSHETVECIIKSSFIFWQVYNDNDEGKKVQTYYNLISLPAILIVDPITGTRMHAWNGMVQPDDLLEQLLPYMDRSPKEYPSGNS